MKGEKVVSFKQFINESTKSSVSFKGKTLEVRKPSRSINDVLVDIKTKEFDNLWSKDKEFYIGKGGRGGLKGRYTGFGIFVLGGEEDIGDDILIPHKPAKYIDSSEISVSEDGEISFTNGRHRFAWLRDQGAKTIPVAMNKKSILNAKKFNLIK